MSVIFLTRGCITLYSSFYFSSVHLKKNYLGHPCEKNVDYKISFPTHGLAKTTKLCCSVFQ